MFSLNCREELSTPSCRTNFVNRSPGNCGIVDSRDVSARLVELRTNSHGVVVPGNTQVADVDVIAASSDILTSPKTKGGIVIATRVLRKNVKADGNVLEAGPVLSKRIIADGDVVAAARVPSSASKPMPTLPLPLIVKLPAPTPAKKFRDP